MCTGSLQISAPNVLAEGGPGTKDATADAAAVPSPSQLAADGSAAAPEAAAASSTPAAPIATVATVASCYAPHFAADLTDADVATLRAPRTETALNMDGTWEHADVRKRARITVSSPAKPMAALAAQLSLDAYGALLACSALVAAQGRIACKAALRGCVQLYFVRPLVASAHVADKKRMIRGQHDRKHYRAGIKPRVQTNFARAAGAPADSAPAFPSTAAAASFAIFSTYADVAHTCLPYPTAAHELAPEEDAAVLHLAQHLITKMSVVKANNDKVAADELAASDATDQGFVRPVALVLAPTRGVAFGVVLRLLELVQRGTRCATLLCGYTH